MKEFALHATSLTAVRQDEPSNTALVPAELTERLRALRDALLTDLVERDVAVRLGLLATMAGEHLLLLGPPGTAKSLVARRLHLAFADAKYFERLLTKFTVPEELFGPLSIKALEEDRYERQTASYLPQAEIAFLDEIFKANSAILNALLTLLNEREFDNGTRREPVPIKAVIGASNELPDGEGLGALFDRFLLRLHVGPVGKENFSQLLALRGEQQPRVPEHLRLTDTDLAAVRSQARQVEVPEDVVALLVALRDHCAAEGIAVSDRRWRKIVHLLQVSALTNGREVVSIWDAWLLQHCLGDEHEDRQKVHAWYAERVGASRAMDTGRLTKIVTAWEARLARDETHKSQRVDSGGQPLFKGADGKPTTDSKENAQKSRAGAPLYRAPARALQRNGHSWNTTPVDQDNGGQGWLRAEVEAMLVNVNGDNIHFAQWKQASTHFDKPANWLMDDSKLLPLMETTRQKRAYIDDCQEQVAAHADVVQDYLANVDAQVASLHSDIEAHLWVTADFVGPAETSLLATRLSVQGLLARLAQVASGFSQLPIQDDIPDLDDSAEALAARPPRKNVVSKRIGV